MYSLLQMDYRNTTYVITHILAIVLLLLSHKCMAVHPVTHVLKYVHLHMLYEYIPSVTKNTSMKLLLLALLMCNYIVVIMEYKAGLNKQENSNQKKCPPKKKHQTNKQANK